MLIVPSPSPVRSDLSAVLIRHARMLHVLRAHMSSWIPSGFDWGAFTLLAHLARSGALRQHELAECAMLDPSTVSRHVGQLVRAGLVERRPDPADGRAVQLVPTGAGHVMYGRVAERREAVLAQLLAGWDAADVDELVRLLGRLNDDFETYRPLLQATSPLDPVPAFPTPGATSATDTATSQEP